MPARCSVFAWPVDDVLSGDFKETVTVYGDVVVFVRALDEKVGGIVMSLLKNDDIVACIDKDPLLGCWSFLRRGDVFCCVIEETNDVVFWILVLKLEEG